MRKTRTKRGWKRVKYVGEDGESEKARRVVALILIKIWPGSSRSNGSSSSTQRYCRCYAGTAGGSSEPRDIDFPKCSRTSSPEWHESDVNARFQITPLLNLFHVPLCLFSLILYVSFITLVPTTDVRIYIYVLYIHIYIYSIWLLDTREMNESFLRNSTRSTLWRTIELAEILHYVLYLRSLYSLSSIVRNLKFKVRRLNAVLNVKM